jgi:mannosyltransferase
VRSISDIVRALQQEGSAPLHLFFLHFWCLVFGDSEFSLRLPSAIAGAAAVPLLFAMGTRMFSRQAGWLAAILAVASPLHVHFSQETRMYPMVALCGLWILSAVDRLFREPCTRSAIILGVALTFGIYLHYYFLLLLPMLGLAVLATEPKRTTAYASLALGLAAVGFAPWLSTFVGQASSSLANWLAGFWEIYPIGFAIPWSLQVLGPGAWYPAFSNMKLASSTPTAILSLGFAAFALVACGKRLLNRWREGDLSPGLTLAAALTPLLVALGLSLFRSPIYLTARYDMIAWGPYMLLVAAALARLQSGWRTATVAVWIGACLFSLAPHFTTIRNENIFAAKGDQIAKQLMKVVRPGELVIFTAGTRTVADYYLRDQNVPFNRVSYPLGSDDHLGWVDGRIDTDEKFAAAEARRFAQTRLTFRGPAVAVCVVAPTSPGTKPLLAELGQRGYTSDATRLSKGLMCLERV